VTEERPQGEWNRANWQAAIVRFFRSRPREWNIRVATELRVQVSDGNYRVPDMTPTDPNLPIEHGIPRPPIPVLGVLSPEDALLRAMLKLADCERMGIQTILALDPMGSTFPSAPEAAVRNNFRSVWERLPRRSGSD
jgi:Uma2 family endonuclease